MMPESSAGFVDSIKTYKKLRCSRWHTGFAFVLAVAGYGTLYLTTTVGAILVVLVADVYLILLLWSAANTPSVETWPGLPHRQPALAILPLMLAALVSAFAAMYLNELPTTPSPRGAAYFSFVNLATFTYDQTSLTTTPTKAIAAGQLVSGLLLLICAFPLLVSRLATFTDDVKGVDVKVGVKTLTFNGCKILLRDGDDASLRIEGDALTWQRGGKTITATASGGPEARTVTVKSHTEPRSAKTISIESDGTYVISET